MFDFVELKNVCDIQSGGTPSRTDSSFYNGSIKWAKISDLEKSGDGFIYDTEEYISNKGLKDIRNRIFEVDTLFLAMYGSVGKTAITKDRMSCNQAILGITVNKSNLIDLKYLKYYFELTKEKLINSARGVALKNLSAGIIKDLKIPLPPLATQKHIAQILDDAAALRDKTTQLIKEYDALAQSIFLDMFGDTWLNNKNYPLSALEEIVNENKIITYGIVQAGENVPDGVPYIRTGDIKNNKILVDQLNKTSFQIAKSYERSKCSTGDIIMSIRATVGTIAILPSELDGANLTQGTARISPNKSIVNPKFLFYTILSKGIQLKIDKQTKGATFREITLARLRKIKIPIPPFSLQNQFAEKIALIEQQKELAKQELKESEDLFNCLLQKAFKGELA